MHNGAAVRPSGIEPSPLRHKNNFDLLRFAFAFMVLLVRSFLRKISHHVVAEQR